jgi:hypothetical protein
MLGVDIGVSRRRVVERPRVQITILFGYHSWVKWRPDGVIRGISGTLEREGRGEYCGYSEISIW